MGFKKYLIATIVLLGLISGFVYSLNLGTYTLDIDTGIKDIVFNQTLPIYIWIIVPAIVLFIATVFHMIFYGSKGYFQRKALLSDINTIEEYIQNRILNKTSSKRIKTNELSDLANILNQLEINVKSGNFECKNEKLKEVVTLVNDINEGKFVSLKSLKLEENNDLELKNILNRIDSDDNFAYEILKSPSKYDLKVVEHAFNNVIENKSLERVKSVLENLTLTNDMVLKLLLKDSKATAEQRFTNSEILRYIQDNKLSNKELIEIARNYKRTMQPEQLIKLFEDLSAADESLTESYLYVLFEYEMLTDIKEILVNSQKDEYIVFKALMDLKDAGKHYSLESLKLS
jgi:hypothetical protein